jgi:UDP-N-acetylglucosamine 1-carboxyvinyltransferase
MQNIDDKFLIKGLSGKRILTGDISVNGAKNAALKAMASSVLFGGIVKMKNIPNIEDVNRMVDLLEAFGVTLDKKNKHFILFNSNNLKDGNFSSQIAKRLRSSIVLTGPVLARVGKITFPHPGGCIIGARPIDLFLDGFKKMGAKVKIKDDHYVIEASDGKLKGSEIFLKNQSVTATETFMMAGVLAKGKTVIKNSAFEPEIKHLADFLSSCGANIKGAGTSTIEITGTGLLKPKKVYTTPPDRIEAGSFLILGALSAKKIKIKNCEPKHLESLIETLKESGVQIKIGKNFLEVGDGGRINNFKAVNIKTHEYPGFPTDLQAPMVVFLTQAVGESMVFETIFEGRLNYVEELTRMGADIKPMDPHRIIINGPKKLRGRDMESPDLRAGLAFVVAAIVAKGNSFIHNVYNIDRGYEKIEERLKKIGVKIERISK